MVNVSFDSKFRDVFKKIDNSLKEKVIKQIEKIKNNPEIGKPMRFVSKGTREVYIGSFRLSYAYSINEDRIILLDLYHKNKR